MSSHAPRTRTLLNALRRCDDGGTHSATQTHDTTRRRQHSHIPTLRSYAAPLLRSAQLPGINIGAVGDSCVGRWVAPGLCFNLDSWPCQKRVLVCECWWCSLSANGPYTHVCAGASANFDVQNSGGVRHVRTIRCSQCNTVCHTHRQL